MPNQPLMRNSMKSQRIALAVLLASLSILTGVFAMIDFQHRYSNEKDTLANQARLVTANLELHMSSANHVLEEIQALYGFTSLELQRERMQSLVNAMPIIRGIGLLDSKGFQIAGTRMQAGTALSDRPYFRNALRNPQRHLLYISTPFRLLTGQVSIALSKAILNDKNEFEGVVYAVLEPDYMEILMSSTLYTPDMWAALLHVNSHDLLLVGANFLDKTRLEYHSKTGQHALFHQLEGSGHAPFEWNNGDARQIVAASTVTGYAGNTERPLMIVMGRDYEVAMAGWIRLVYIQLGLLLFFAAASFAGLLFYQYRRKQYAVRRAADQWLIEAREHDYRVIVERTTDCVVRLDSKGYLSYANPAFRELCAPCFPQTPPDEFLDLVVPADRPAAEEALRMALSRPSEHRVQLRCQVNNNVHHMEWTLCSIPGVDRAVAGLIGVGRDISAHVALNTELRSRAEHDSLTGLANRGRFSEVATATIERAHRLNQPVAIMMIDLDHFKKVNDTWGHNAGDIALQSCAKILREQCRAQDMPARLGGEEFTILMIGGGDDAQGVAERILNAIAGHPVLLPDGQQIRLTTSIGVAVLQADDKLETMLARADMALYSAKQKGRNRVELAP